MSENGDGHDPTSVGAEVKNAPEVQTTSSSTPEKQKDPEKYEKSDTLTEAWGNVVEARQWKLPNSEVQTVGVYTATDVNMPDFEQYATVAVFEKYVRPVEIQKAQKLILGEITAAQSSVYTTNQEMQKEHHAREVIHQMRKWINEQNEEREKNGKPPLKIGIYGGGIAWVGDTHTKTEQSKALGGFAGISLAISQDASSEKMAEAGNVGAIDFMRDAGYDICFTIDPKKPPSEMVSSLRADAVVRDELLRRLTFGENKNDKTGNLTSKVAEVDWSNSGFKKAELFKQAAQSLSEVIRKMTDSEREELQNKIDQLLVKRDEKDKNDDVFEDFHEIMGLVNRSSNRTSTNEGALLTDNQKRDRAFDNPGNALRFLLLHHGVDTYLGGAPAEAKDLAAPFRREVMRREPTLGDKMKHAFNEGRRMIANKAVQLAGNKLDSQLLVDTLQKSKIKALKGSAGWFFTRLMEMGRAHGMTQDEIDSFKADALLNDLTKAALGDARIVTLMDTSGRTVASDGSLTATELDAAYSVNSIAVETLRQDTGLTALAKEGITNIPGPENASLDPEHAEIKQGALLALQRFANKDRIGEDASNVRWIRVNPTVVSETLPSGAVLHETYKKPTPVPAS
jgi:hypothetical protein